MRRSELTEKMLAATGRFDARGIAFVSGCLRKITLNYDELVAEDKAKGVEQLLLGADARELAQSFCEGLLLHVCDHFNVKLEEIDGYLNN
jgi:hypothetical protein